MQSINDRILCSVGLRGDCTELVKEAMQLSLSLGYGLHIIHVVRPLPDDVVSTLRTNIINPSRLSSIMQERTSQWRDQMLGLLENFWNRYPELKEEMKDLSVTISVEEGYAPAVIANYAFRGGFKMIVMAANKQRYPTVYAGKVTRGVISRAKLPVVVVPVTC